MCRNLPQRLQHKVTQVHLRVGDDQVLVVQHQVVVEENIQVQRPGAPVDQPLPVGGLLDVVEAVQQLMGRQAGLQLQSDALERGSGARPL